MGRIHVVCLVGFAIAACTSASTPSQPSPDLPSDASAPISEPSLDASSELSDATAVPEDVRDASRAPIDPFDPAVIHELRLALDAEALAILADPARENEKAWTRGTLSFAGETFVDVGVRRKGESTFRAYPQKMSLKIRFDRYVAGQTLQGLTELTLNNMITDRTQLAERLAYHAFHALGVPAQRANSVHLTVISPSGEEDFGLYANVETPNDQLLERLAPGRGHTLYEASTGDWTGTTGPVDEKFEEEAADVDHADLLALFAAVGAARAESLLADVATVLEPAAWLRYCAAEAAVGQVDGYAYGHVGGHNYFLAGDRDGRFTLLPWSLDLSFTNEIVNPPRADLPGKANFADDAETLLQRCKAAASCWSRYTSELESTMTTLESLHLENVAASWRMQIAPFVLAPTFDSRKRLGARGASNAGPGPNSYANAWNGAHTKLQAWLTERPSVVRAQLAPP